MITALILFLTPTLLFVFTFLYETYLSFFRLKNQSKGKYGYVSATWEVTHTLLVAGVVILLMLLTHDITDLSAAIFTSTFIAGIALSMRSALYCYIFFVRKTSKINFVDWLFALSHVVAALFLVVTVLKALWFIYDHAVTINTQFYPYFIPGLIATVALCAVPIITLYKTKD